MCMANMFMGPWRSLSTQGFHCYAILVSRSDRFLFYRFEAQHVLWMHRVVELCQASRTASQGL